MPTLMNSPTMKNQASNTQRAISLNQLKGNIAVYNKR
jgi:hypothetical protein